MNNNGLKTKRKIRILCNTRKTFGNSNTFQNFYNKQRIKLLGHLLRMTDDEHEQFVNYTAEFPEYIENAGNVRQDHKR